MKYEPYSIRAGFILFKQQLEECQSLLKSMESLPEILILQRNFVILLDMCKKQGVYVVHKSNATVSISACLNSLMNVKSELLDGALSEIAEKELVNIERLLSDLIASVSTKCDEMTEEITKEEAVKETVEKLEDYRAPTELLQAYREAAKDASVKSKDEMAYIEINKRIERETRLVQKTLDQGLTFVSGSITVNSPIMPYDLKDLEHSVLKIPGIQFNHARKEVITPIYVFHNQKLALINVRKRRLSIKKGQYQDSDQIFQEQLEKIERSTNLVNQTKKFRTPYLMSPRFKNLRFLWFSGDVKAFKAVKEGTVALLW